MIFRTKKPPAFDPARFVECFWLGRQSRGLGELAQREAWERQNRARDLRVLNLAKVLGGKS